MKQIILASASPRRKELLEQIGLEFEIIPAKGEEVITKTAPHEVVMELSRQKALEVAGMVSGFSEHHDEIMTPQDMLVIGADTVVAAQNAAGDMEILGKPKDEADAYRMLSMLSGKAHAVYTGVTLVFLDKNGKAGAHSFFEKTDVYMRKMSDLEIKRYIATGEPSDKTGRRIWNTKNNGEPEWKDKTGGRIWNTHNGYQPEWYGKAGGYAIQGIASKFVERIEGDFYNVVGLPISHLWQTLKEFGIDI